MDAEKNHNGRAAAPAFEPVDSTLDAVRLMMEAETRHESVHGHAERARVGGREDQASRAASVQDTQQRSASETPDPDANPETNRRARRRQRRGKAALPEIVPADTVETVRTRDALHPESAQAMSDDLFDDVSENFTEESAGPARSRRGPIMWLVGRLRSKRRSGEVEAAEADWGDADPLLSCEEGGLDEDEVQMFAPERAERPNRDHTLADGVEAAGPEGHRREVYHAESGEAEGYDEDDRAGLFAGLAARVRAYQPKFRHSIMIAILAIMIWNPWLLPGLVFVAIWVALIAHLTVGPDRMGEIITALREKAAARFPEKAAEVHRRAELGAERLERLIARLPGRWKDKIQLPDFSGQSDVLFEGDDPFTRLAPRRHDQRGAGTPAE
ncbi:hypothetical protein [Rhodalgimonas zhirmunskyi]|uniref:Uncharacterized protein n=1 Tax=Rhodalgimonas zhirmunskyi TaxID=2964767 RepID=A0AAJ1UGN1_9RHOB|nr:hypothetical protein [Rhodoalgimonas zhirmunskyi]MDQ2095741.1 hypothetical protein [Rhodoalgimonas zhirmunskyi]